MFSDRIKTFRPARDAGGEAPSWTDLAPAGSGCDAEADAEVIYEGRCDLQDTISTSDRSRLGDVDVEHMAKAYLPSKSDARAHRPGDRAECKFGSGEVHGVGDLDGVVYIRIDPNQGEQ